MAERDKEEFVVTDRRKFRMEGGRVEHVDRGETPRDESAEVPAPTPAPEPPLAAAPVPEPVPEQKLNGAITDEAATSEAPQEQGPSAEDVNASHRAYEATAERMDDLMRANNPGAPHDGPMTFIRVIQSIYMTAIMQLGLNAQPGQQMRVDLLGARHSIDMLGVLGDKVAGNTTPEEDKLLQAALFELRMSFLEITQMLAQQAQAKAAGKAPGPPMPGGKITL